MEGPTYRVKRKRRRKGKTDYHARIEMIKSGKVRAVIRRTLRRIIVHFSTAKIKGDETLSYTTSEELAEYGWNYNKADLPAAYLTGYLAGLKAKEEEIREVIPDFGIQNSTKGNKLNTAVKGLNDAGVDVPHSETTLPSKERITGKHISEYARKLKEHSKEKYETQFGSYLEEELDPTEIPKIFSQTLSKIANDHGEEAPDL